MIPATLAWALAAAIPAFLVALLSAPRLAAAARRRGHLDRPGGRKTQDSAVPYAGGGALALGIGASVLPALLLAASQELGIATLPDAIAPFAAGALRRAPLLALLLLGALVLGWMGRIDDRRGLGVAPRLLIQLAVAFLVAFAGVRATLFVESAWVHLLATTLWIAFMTNAFNFIDNMDGLACGAGVLGALGCAAVAGLDGQVLVAALGAATAGAFAGVLAHNRPPARLYLGDEGSMLGGFLLATLAILVSWQSERVESSAPWRTILVPGCVLALPLADGIAVTVARLRRGVGPWTPGRDHLSHRLAERLGSRRRAVAVLLGASSSLAALGVFLAHPGAGGAAGALLLLLVGGVVAAGILKRRGAEPGP